MFNNLPLITHLRHSSDPPPSAVCLPRKRLVSDPVLVQTLRSEASIQFEADILAPDTLYTQRIRETAPSRNPTEVNSDAEEVSPQEGIQSVLQESEEPRNPFAKIAQWVAAHKAAQKMRIPAVWEVSAGLFSLILHSL